jgi:hypothetical protein
LAPPRKEFEEEYIREDALAWEREERNGARQGETQGTMKEGK